MDDEQEEQIIYELNLIYIDACVSNGRTYEVFALQKLTKFSSSKLTKTTDKVGTFCKSTKCKIYSCYHKCYF